MGESVERSPSSGVVEARQVALIVWIAMLHQAPCAVVACLEVVHVTWVSRFQESIPAIERPGLSQEQQNQTAVRARVSSASSFNFKVFHSGIQKTRSGPDSRANRSLAQKVVLADAHEGANAVSPANLLTFAVGAAEIGDAHLVNCARPLSQPWP